MNKEEVIARLSAIKRMLMCMNKSEFDAHLSDSSFRIEFDYFSFNEDSKISIQIKMDKVKV